MKNENFSNKAHLKKKIFKQGIKKNIRMLRIFLHILSWLPWQHIFPVIFYKMHCKGKLKLRSHNTSYCLIEVVTKAGLIVYSTNIISCKYWSNIYKNFNYRAEKQKMLNFVTFLQNKKKFKQELKKISGPGCSTC
jgi:hypothetical protein